MKKFSCFCALGFILLFSSVKAQVNVAADDPKIVYWGRVDFSDPKAPAFEYPGVTIRAKFTGTSLSAKLNDYAPHGASTTNYFYKIVDGGLPQKLKF